MWRYTGFPCTQPTQPALLEFQGDSKGPSMTQMSKSELIQTIAEQHSGNLTRKDVKGIIESIANIGYNQLKKTGMFVLPRFAKFVVIKKPATKARKGINPFTKEPTIFKATGAEGHQSSPGKSKQR